MSNELSISSANVQSTIEPWPNNWTYPNTYVYIASAEEYANEVEVEQNEHVAVLRFYRRRDKVRSLVKEITVPLGVLEWLQALQADG